MRFSGFRLFGAAGLLVVMLSGCANLTEQRVVRQFADALHEENESALRDVTTSRFHSRALRSEDALRDLSIVQLPEKDLEIVNVEDVSETRKLVTVEQNGSNRRVQLALDSDKPGGRWKIDDVIMRSRHSGVQVSMSVTDQMDLVLSVREFLSSLPDGSREEILSQSSPGLRQTLESLPPTWMARLTESVAGEYEPSIARRPEAQMNEADAVVKLPSRNGHIVLRTVRKDERWLVDDIEVRPRRNVERHPGSIRRQAEAIAASTRFLEAYATGDSEMLKLASTGRFYNQSLSLAGQSVVPLPTSDYAPVDFDLQAFNGHASLSLPVDGTLIRIDMDSVDAADMEFNDADDRLTSLGADYRIEEITLYDDKSGIGRRLTAMYAAPARAALMVRSIRERNLPIIRQLSSASLNKAVWDRLEQEQLTFLPLNVFNGQSLEFAEVRSPGVMTEIEMKIGDRNLVCVMREESGGLRIDDIRLYEGEAQTSLKTRLALVVPIVQFAQHWSDGHQRELMEVCSSDFNRRTWDQLAEIPKESFGDLPGRLIAPVRSSRVTQQRAVVQLGHDEATATSIHLVQERSRWLVEDIQMREPSGRTVAMQAWMRKEITRQLLGENGGSIQLVSHRPSIPAASAGQGRPATSVRPVSSAMASRSQPSFDTSASVGNLPGPSSDPGVVHADYRTEVPSRTSLPETRAAGAMVFSPGQSPRNLQAAPDAELRPVPESAANNDSRQEAVAVGSADRFAAMLNPDSRRSAASPGNERPQADIGMLSRHTGPAAESPQREETEASSVPAEGVLFRPQPRPSRVEDPADSPVVIPR